MTTPVPSASAEPAPAPSPIPLSILIRTHNEADRIAETIRAASALGGEIVVIDSGSTDATVALAEAEGARVIYNGWKGFGPQRYFGEDQCSHDMIFGLDADEITPPAFVSEIRRLFQQPSTPRLMIVKKAFVLPYWKKPPLLPFSAVQIYIYDRRIARTNPNPNWDKLDITGDGGKPYKVRAHVWHFSLRDWNHGVAKANYVAKLAANTMRPRSGAVLLLRLWVEPPLSFFRYYILRRYFLAGADGFSMAMISAFGRWLRIAMMLERVKYGPKP
ncbi:glycosyltransferase family 2 protein [soil metagenome]